VRFSSIQPQKGTLKYTRKTTKSRKKKDPSEPALLDIRHSKLQKGYVNFQTMKQRDPFMNATKGNPNEKRFK